MRWFPAEGGSRRFFALLLFLILPVWALSAQIGDAETGCSFLRTVETALRTPEDIVLSFERWSDEGSDWLYEVETSSGAKLLVRSNGEIVEQLRSPVGRSRKQLERETVARAIREARIPDLCTLIRHHYRSNPDSLVLELSVEYDHGEFEGELSFRHPSRDARERETEWEWDD